MPAPTAARARSRSLRWLAALAGTIATWSVAAAASGPPPAGKRATAAAATRTTPTTTAATPTAATTTAATPAAAMRTAATTTAASLAATRTSAPRTALAPAAAMAPPAARAHATSAPATAHDEPLVLALGLASPSSDTRLMERFAKTVNAKHYGDVYGSWHDHRPADEIYANEDRMMAKAHIIHFNLSEMNWEKYVAWANKPQAEREVAHTNHELLQVVKSRDLRAKTVFYLYGKRTDPCEKAHVTGGVGSYAKQMQLMQSVLCGGG